MCEDQVMGWVCSLTVSGYVFLGLPIAAVCFAIVASILARRPPPAEQERPDV